MNIDWQTITDIIEQDKTVAVTDSKGNTYTDKILTSDHRAMFIKVHEDENKVVFNRNIVKFEIVGE